MILDQPPPASTNRHRWSGVPLSLYCWTCAPSVRSWLCTARTFPLLRFMMRTVPAPLSTRVHTWSGVPLSLHWVTSALSARDMLDTASSLPECWFWIRRHDVVLPAGVPSRENAPPTTGRSAKPRWVASATTYQSLNGTRCGVLLTKLYTPSIRVLRMLGWSVSHAAVHNSQSALV